MNALTRNNHRRGVSFRFGPKQITEGAGSINHNPCGGAKFVARFNIASTDAIHKSLSVFRQPRNLGIIEQGCSLLESRYRHVDEQSRVVELSVVVNRAATQTVC